MKPLSLRIERFGSFVEPQVFEFPAGPGLYFMQGRNDAEPKLGSNGSGKSTVWKALTWCLFGKDPRGLKAGDVANWETPKGAAVNFCFDVEGVQYEIKRTHSPNAWLLSADGEDWHDLAKDETNPLADMLRLEYETWLMTALMAQGEPYFLDLRADAKAAVFSEVMGLDKWLEYSRRAADAHISEDKAVGRLEQDLAYFDGRLSAMKVDEFDEQVLDWESQRNGYLAELSEAHAVGVETVNTLKQALIKATDDAAAALANATGEQTHIDKKMVLLEKYTAEHQQALERFAELRERLRSIIERADLLRDAKACPTCGTVGMKHVLGSMKSAALAINEEVEAADKKVDVAARDVGIMRDGIQKAQEGAQKALRAVDAAQRALSSARTAHEAQERELDRLEDEVERVAADRNPFEALAADAARNRRQLEVDRAAIEDQHVLASTRCAQLGFWVRGFKEVRLALIGEALDHFAIEANSCAQALGLSGWELVFEVDRETKSGSIKSGFNVFVRSPHNDRQVPWEAWSGGEAQRLRLAAQMGLSNLIRATTGADVALEVWDESTEGMSDAGIADMLDALAERARVEQRQVWVVDHRVLGYAGWDGVVTVVKGKKGSRFELS